MKLVLNAVTFLRNFDSCKFFRLLVYSKLAFRRTCCRRTSSLISLEEHASLSFKSVELFKRVNPSESIHKARSDENAHDKNAA